MDEFRIIEASVVIDSMLEYLAYKDYTDFENDVNNGKIEVVIKQFIFKKRYLSEQGTVILARAIKDGKVTMKMNEKVIFNNNDFILWAEKEGWLVEVTSLTGPSKKQFIMKE